MARDAFFYHGPTFERVPAGYRFYDEVADVSEDAWRAITGRRLEEFLIRGIAGAGVDWTEAAAQQIRQHREPGRSWLTGAWSLVGTVYMPPSVPRGLWTVVPSLIIALEKAEVLRGRQVENIILTLGIDAAFPRIQLELDPIVVTPTGPT